MPIKSNHIGKISVSSFSTILCKTLWEKLRNQEKLDKKEKLWYLFLRIFWAIGPNIYFFRGDRALDYISIDFWDFLDIFIFCKISLNPIQYGGGGVQKGHPLTSFSPLTSTNVELISQKFLSFSFNRFATLV